MILFNSIIFLWLIIFPIKGETKKLFYTRFSNKKIVGKEFNYCGCGLFLFSLKRAEERED